MKVSSGRLCSRPSPRASARCSRRLSARRSCRRVRVGFVLQYLRFRGRRIGSGRAGTSRPRPRAAAFARRVAAKLLSAVRQAKASGTRCAASSDHSVESEKVAISVSSARHIEGLGHGLERRRASLPRSTRRPPAASPRRTRPGSCSGRVDAERQLDLAGRRARPAREHAASRAECTTRLCCSQHGWPRRRRCRSPETAAPAFAVDVPSDARSPSFRPPRRGRRRRLRAPRSRRRAPSERMPTVAPVVVTCRGPTTTPCGA